jgi:sensor histidine kinase YesM
MIGYEVLMLKNKRMLPIFFSFLPFMISGTMEMLNYYFRYMPVRITMHYGFTLSVLLQFIQFIRVIKANAENIRKAEKLEYEQLQSHIAVMLSQIQPHFLFNTLNDIMALYRDSPKLAENTLISFTRYLRGNMNSLNQLKLIPFTQEMDHVKNYLDIEQVRFGERLNIVFELSCTDFYLPVLTVQPLIENAIRHGITKKREGGTITVRTYEDSDKFYVEILDNGIGFDITNSEKDGTHTGIENVRTRLKSMCNGELDIKSTVNVGTSAVIRIPKKIKLS